MQVGTTKDQGLYNKPSVAVHPGALAAGTLPQCNTIVPLPHKKKLLVMSSLPFRGVQGSGPSIEIRTSDWLGSNSLEIMDHDSYTPDLTLTGFHCFRGPLRNTWLVRDLQHTST